MVYGLSHLVLERLVGLDVDVWKLFLLMKSCILDSYWSVGKMTREFPLSAWATMESLDFSLDCTDFRVLVSRCEFMWGVGLLWRWSMWLATCLLK